MSTLGEHKEILLAKAKAVLNEWDMYSAEDDMITAMESLREEIKLIEESE